MRNHALTVSLAPSGKPAPLSGRPDLEYEDEVYEAYLAGLEEDKEIEKQAQKAAEEAAQKESGSDP